MGKTRIIGIDPGSRFTGYGIIDSEASEVRLVAAGCIRLSAQTFSHRLKHLFDEISRICLEYKPSCAAVEQVFYAQNVRSALQLGQVRGVILLGLIRHECQIFEYSALEMKSAVTGYGRAEKNQIRKMIELIFHTTFEGSKSDLTDALGLAVTHAHVSEFKSKLVPL